MPEALPRPEPFNPRADPGALGAHQRLLDFAAQLGGQTAHWIRRSTRHVVHLPKRNRRSDVSNRLNRAAGCSDAQSSAADAVPMTTFRLPRVEAEIDAYEDFQGGGA